LTYLAEDCCRGQPCEINIKPKAKNDHTHSDSLHAQLRTERSRRRNAKSLGGAT
jgi:hypothetical protein